MPHAPPARPPRAAAFCLAARSLPASALDARRSPRGPGSVMGWPCACHRTLPSSYPSPCIPLLTPHVLRVRRTVPIFDMLANALAVAPLEAPLPRQADGRVMYLVRTNSGEARLMPSYQDASRLLQAYQDKARLLQAYQDELLQAYEAGSLPKALPEAIDWCKRDYYNEAGRTEQRAERIVHSDHSDEANADLCVESPSLPPPLPGACRAAPCAALPSPSAPLRILTLCFPTASSSPRD